MSDTTGNDTLMAEIGEAVKSMEQPNVTEPQVKPGATTQPEPTEPKVEEPSTKEAFVADDEILKRGILAGLDVADVKAFASKEQAERIIAALEAKKETPKNETKTGTKDGDDGFPVEDFEKAVNEMENEKDDDGEPTYDPKFVAMFKAMGGLLKSQANEIAVLKKAGASAEAQTAFDKAFGGLSEGVRGKIDAATKEKLKTKFDFLTKAHKFAKDKATDEEVFEEAKKLVIGDLDADDTATRVAEALAKRQNLTLARPGGESGQRGSDKPMTEEDIVDALYKKLTT